MTEEKQLYCVAILRKDEQHVIALESYNYDECFKLWEELTDKWEKCANEHKPFKLIVNEPPLVTAFEPGLISTITIRPYSKTVNNTNNPYYKKMQSEGFSQTFGRNPTDILDGGYKL